MVEIGKVYRLKVLTEQPFGIYFDADNLGKVLLPRSYMTRSYTPGEFAEVVIYRDGEERLIASDRKPLAEVGQFAWLKVVMTNAIGAFLDWGLPKDLLVPLSEQRTPMAKGEYHPVYLYLDAQTDRPSASGKLGKFLDKNPPEYEAGEAVDLLLIRESELGFQAIVNGRHMGLLYEQEIFRPVACGDRISGYVLKIREDGKIDLSQQQPGYQKIDDMARKILDLIVARGGFIPVTDKSDPEVIYRIFGISKKNYKKAIGALYKARLIALETDGVRLTEA